MDEYSPEFSNLLSRFPFPFKKGAKYKDYREHIRGVKQLARKMKAATDNLSLQEQRVKAANDKRKRKLEKRNG